MTRSWRSGRRAVGPGSRVGGRVLSRASCRGTRTFVASHARTRTRARPGPTVPRNDVALPCSRRRPSARLGGERRRRRSLGAAGRGARPARLLARSRSLRARPAPWRRPRRATRRPGAGGVRRTRELRGQRARRRADGERALRPADRDVSAARFDRRAPRRGLDPARPTRNGRSLARPAVAAVARAPRGTDRRHRPLRRSAVAAEHEPARAPRAATPHAPCRSPRSARTGTRAAGRAARAATRRASCPAPRRSSSPASRRSSPARAGPRAHARSPASSRRLDRPRMRGARPARGWRLREPAAAQGRRRAGRPAPEPRAGGSMMSRR